MADVWIAGCHDDLWRDDQGRTYERTESDSQILRANETVWHIQLPSRLQMGINDTPVNFPDPGEEVLLKRTVKRDKQDKGVEKSGRLQIIDFADAGAQQQHKREADLVCYFWKDRPLRKH